jgi:hypothetical protein
MPGLSPAEYSLHLRRGFLRLIRATHAISPLPVLKENHLTGARKFGSFPNTSFL